MAIRPFHTRAYKDSEVTNLQSDVERTLDDLAQYFPGISILCAGKLVETGTMTGPLTDNEVFHNLGRVAVGFFVVKTFQIFNLRLSPNNNPNARNSILVQTDVGFNVGATLWVF